MLLTNHHRVFVEPYITNGNTNIPASTPAHASGSVLAFFLIALHNIILLQFLALPIPSPVVSSFGASISSTPPMTMPLSPRSRSISYATCGCALVVVVVVENESGGEGG
jgi:hypothetical protein